jgi:hypothetical protein
LPSRPTKITLLTDIEVSLLLLSNSRVQYYQLSY